MHAADVGGCPRACTRQCGRHADTSHVCVRWALGPTSRKGAEEEGAEGANRQVDDRADRDAARERRVLDVDGAQLAVLAQLRREDERDDRRGEQ